MENKINNGGSAFPVVFDGNIKSNGMSLRDYFAAQAMQSLLTLDVETTIILSNPNERHIWEWISSDAYNLADAMLKMREK